MCCAKVAKDSNPSHGQIKLATDWEIIFVMLFPPTLFIDFVDLDCLLPFFPAITTASSLLSNTIPQLAPSIDDRDCWCAKLIFFLLYGAAAGTLHRRSGPHAQGDKADTIESDLHFDHDDTQHKVDPYFTTNMFFFLPWFKILLPKNRSYGNN